MFKSFKNLFEEKMIFQKSKRILKYHSASKNELISNAELNFYLILL
jgi:hypothetical protein